MFTGNLSTPSCCNVERSGEENREPGEKTGDADQEPEITVEFGEFAGKYLGIMGCYT